MNEAQRSPLYGRTNATIQGALHGFNWLCPSSLNVPGYLMNDVKGSHSIEAIFFAELTDPIECIKLNSEDHSQYGWFAVDGLAKAQSGRKGEDVPEQIAMLKAFQLLAASSPKFS